MVAPARMISPRARSSNAGEVADFLDVHDDLRVGQTGADVDEQVGAPRQQRHRGALVREALCSSARVLGGR